jgi:hypothetical protein
MSKLSSTSATPSKPAGTAQAQQATNESDEKGSTEKTPGFDIIFAGEVLFIGYMFVRKQR